MSLINSTPVVSYPTEASDWCADLEFDSFWFEHRNQCIVSLLNKYRFPKFIYDIGGGNGVVSLYLNKHNYQTVLIEPSPSAVARAKNRGITQAICATFESYEFKTKSNSAFGLFDVLEHVEHPSLWLEKIKNNIQPEGLIILTVPAFSWAWSIDDKYAGHYRRYSKAQLIHELETAGFDIIYLSYFFSWLLLPIILFRSIPYLLKLQHRISVHQEHRSHLANAPWLKKLVIRLFSPEIWMLSKGWSLPFGSSLIAVAKLR